MNSTHQTGVLSAPPSHTQLIIEKMTAVATASQSNLALTTLLVTLPLVAVFFFVKQDRDAKRPPRLDETIPFVSNLWQFLTNKRLFITRARTALALHPIIRCRLGPLDLYLVRGGPHATSSMFRATCHSDPWILRIMQSAGYAPADLEKLRRDDTGSGTVPRTGSVAAAKAAKVALAGGEVGGNGTMGLDERVWYALHRLYDATMVGTKAVDGFAGLFQQFFDEELIAASSSSPSNGGWISNVHIYDTLKRTMTAAATRTTLGPLALDVNPGFVDAFWSYEKHVETLAFGVPDWLNRPAVQARAKFTEMCQRWYESADAQFDWDAAETDPVLAEPDSWEPVFGSALSRGLAKWARGFGFGAESMGPVFILLLFGLHANTIPVCTWLVMELIKDPELLRAVKEEIATAELPRDDQDGSFKGYDHRKLAALPLLQSIYTEVLRLHVGVLITRTCAEPIKVAGYTVPKGSILQAPTEVGHLDEAVWSTAEHPASEFWAYRHVKEKRVKDEVTGQASTKLEFSLAGRSASFFPFGGGIGMCPGRNIAKPEVFLAAAMVVSRFEIEEPTWLKPDGSVSDRAAQNDVNYANSVAAAPDRELKVRWRMVR
ncbi:cytochrome P450 [Dichotomopilus funicola]|uniref:Cytochrome P450 n=1 Tax=Dichotomopilus funicola TaxID=1934379 RepID=A0AAN6V153_9PEZI|nr:cytochrome P450 [Dichotomopilus funicola]